jgi:hypothetical protein
MLKVGLLAVTAAWKEVEKSENICRRGFIRPTPNGHAFEPVDGTPFVIENGTLKTGTAWVA